MRERDSHSIGNVAPKQLKLCEDEFDPVAGSGSRELTLLVPGIDPD